MSTPTADFDLKKDFESFKEAKEYSTLVAKNLGFTVVTRDSGATGALLVCSLWGGIETKRPNGCGCKFQLSFGPSNGRWRFRDSTNITHTNHELTSPMQRPPGLHIDSEALITVE